MNLQNLFLHRFREPGEIIQISQQIRIGKPEKHKKVMQKTLLKKDAVLFPVRQLVERSRCAAEKKFKSVYNS
jgi:hypothetical protein